jgi:hypothetical protein
LQNLGIILEEFTLERLAELICGDDKTFAPVYRSSWYLTQFFESVGLPRFKHDGTTRKIWVLDSLRQCSNDELNQVILGLASPKAYKGNVEQLELALKSLNEVLNPEGFNIEINGVKPVLNSIEPRLSRPLNSLPNGETFILEKPDFKLLGIESEYGALLDSRWEEVEKCLQSHAYLASIILMGSLLEGILQWALMKYQEKAFRASASPKDSKTGKPRPINDWSLNQMIDVTYELGWLEIDVKRFSHSVREFRNLVHPYQQFKDGAIPDEDTCKISWQVVRASINDLEKHFVPLSKNGG